APRMEAPRASSKVEIVVIGASTGGPQTLGRILGALPATLPLPILIVQHIAPGFIHGLATWLNEISPLRAKVAEDSETVCTGTVYLAPNACQMGIGRNRRIQLSEERSDE